MASRDFPSPSTRDGLPLKEEKAIRLIACKLISDVARAVKPQISNSAVVNTAKNFYHKFYMNQSLVKQKNYKSEECARPLKEIIWAWNQVDFDPKTGKASFPFGRYQGEDGKKEIEESAGYLEMRKNILGAERILLDVLGFDFPVNHAQEYASRFVKYFESFKSEREQKCLFVTGDSNDAHSQWTEFGNLVLTTAYSMINDSAATTLGVEGGVEAAVVAAGCVSLALKTLHFETCPLAAWSAKLSDYCAKDPRCAKLGVMTAQHIGGEVVEVAGSGAKPYQLHKRGNVYSCSCSIWRHIDDIEQRRTCKHLQQLRGEKAETGRVGEEGLRKSEEKRHELAAAAVALGKRPADQPHAPHAHPPKRQHPS